MKGFVPLIALAAAGCTTHLRSVAPAAGGAPITGWSYNLPSLSYDVAVRRTLTSCPTAATPDVGFDVVASATPTWVASEEVVVDYAGLANGLKTTTVAFENYPSGMLKSVNASAADQSAAAIKSAVGSVVGIAKLAIGVPPLPGAAGVAGGTPAAPKWTATVVCTPAAEKQVALLGAQKAAAEAVRRSADGAQAALAAFDADHASDQDQAADVKKQRAALATSTREAAAKAKAADAALAKTFAGLTASSRFAHDYAAAFADGATLGATEGDFISRMFQLRLVLDRGGSLGAPSDEPIPASLSYAPADVAKQSSGQQAIATLIAASGVAVDFRRLGTPPAAAALNVATECGTKRPCGVLYRAVAPARLQICRNVRVEACGTLAAGDANLVLRDDQNGPQFGALRSLGLRNDAFESNSLSATFREDGSVATMSYGKTTAGAVFALGALGDVVSGAASIDEYNRGGEMRALSAATARANARADLATARVKAAEAEKAAREAQANLDALNED